jgi:putative transposase
MTVEMKPLPAELIDALLADYKRPEDLIGQNGLLKQLTKALVERALQAEMTDHLGHSKNELVANEAGNTRNGRSKKTLKGDFGELPIEVPRDRAGTFEPQLIGKHQTRWSGFDDKILSLYARGMTVREIQSHLQEMVRRRGFTDLDFIGDRCRHGRGQSLAVAPTRCAVPHRLHGLHSRQSTG